MTNKDTVKIGELTWMAENLNFVTDSSWCYDNDNANCKKYGRLYDWNTAMTVCPAGWHLPDTADWNNLMEAVGGLRAKNGNWEAAGKKLKSKIGWKDLMCTSWEKSWDGCTSGSIRSGNGTDDYGFSALPGGGRYPGGIFDDIGKDGHWWSATVKSGYEAHNRSMGQHGGNVDEFYCNKSGGLSVRCVRDN